MFPDIYRLFYNVIKKYLFSLGIILSFLSIYNYSFGQSTSLDSIYWWIDSTFHLPESQRKDYLDKAAVLSQKNELTYEYAIVLLEQSKLATDQADYTKAFILQDSSLQISRDNQFDDLYGDNLLQKGIIYIKLEQFDEAEKILKEALHLPYTQSHPLRKADVLNNLGILAATLGNNTEGLEYFQQASAIFDKEDLSTVLSNMATLYLVENRVAEALKIFQDDLAFRKAKQDKLGQAKSYGNIGYAHYLLEDYPKAFKAYEESIAIARREGYKEVLVVTYRDLAETYQTKGNYKKALASFQLYHELEFENIGEQTQKEVSALQIKYDTAIKNQQLTEQAKQIQLLEQKRIIRQQRFMVISILLGSLALMALFLYWRKKTKLEQIQATKSLKEEILQKELVLKEQQEKLLKTQLANKNKDITTLALDISRKNDFSRLMQRELERLEKGLPKAYQSKIRHLKMNTLTHLEINEDVANLQNNIEQINHQFYENLDNIAKLSQSEKQICGLIRMNLSNKQIALIRNTTTDSAKVFRYRIRKKIGLQPEEDVVAFLQKI